MSSNLPSIDELRESFKQVYHGPDGLQREYDLLKQSKRFDMSLDNYRRLYEKRGEEKFEPYPKCKNLWHTSGDWSQWIWNLPYKKKLALACMLARKGTVKLVQSGVILAAVVGIGRYVWEGSKREEQTHYQAWQVINSAAGQENSGGRIEALQNLNKDDISLARLNAQGAHLPGIELQKAKLDIAKLGNAYLINAKLNNANLFKTDLNSANLSNADLSSTNLIEADFQNTNFNNANLGNANLKAAIVGCYDKHCTNFKGVKDITPEQIKQAKNWQSACYDPEFRKQLGLPPQNPLCAGEVPAK